jgi:hypothetical protein
MLTALRSRGHRAHRSGRRGTRAAPRAAALAAVFLVLALGNAAPPEAGASARHMSSKAPLAHRPGVPAGHPGNVTSGVPSPSLEAQHAAYWEPPALTDPAAPGVTIASGLDQPDPFMLSDGGRDYLFTSQGQGAANIPVSSGVTVSHLGPVTDALPTLPPWAEPGVTWAPDVHRFGDHYILTFTAAVRGSNPSEECIGNAISTRVDGPYLPAPTPLVCQVLQGGDIDPRVFVDANGTTYLLWKSEENADVNGTALTNIYSQRLSPDGAHLVDQPTRIFGPDEPWQGRIVEAPDLVQVQGGYYLFYSGGWFNQPDYAIGVAYCAGPLGPCADPTATPFLASNLQGAGPGEESVFADASGVWLLYSPFRSYLPLAGPPRPVVMARLGFGPLGPYLAVPGAVS